jgi:hypothetical protein
VKTTPAAEISVYIDPHAAKQADSFYLLLNERMARLP